VATFSADTGFLGATERCSKVTHEKAVDPDRAGDQVLAEILGSGSVSGYDACGEAVVGSVRERESLFVGGECLHRENRPEHLFAEDFAVQCGVADECGREVVRAEFVVDSSSVFDGRAIGHRAIDEALDAGDMVEMDVRTYLRVLLARIALLNLGCALSEALSERVCDTFLDE